MEKEERTTENKVKRRVPMSYEKYWTESGRGVGQGNIINNNQLYFDTLSREETLFKSVYSSYISLANC